ncbi:translation initiation factor Sui1 [Magnetococcus sp. PR-3]|uniref:translation initiation factor Sui1 n=1 Tax=Magnetococcus sp. PR-3 TaxID=3120355 RepID=UPI002FCE32CD
MKDRIVYSTEQGRICPSCGKVAKQCSCARKKQQPPSDGIVRISRETKGRKGKGVTLIKGLSLDSAALVKMAKQLKAACGSGGTVKNGVIEIQGDHREHVLAFLKKQGLTVKLAGG